MTLQAPAPQVEIGYAQAVNYNWWLYENETTPELIWPQSTFVFDSMRRTDSQVTSVLRAMTLPVRRTPWRIDPNGASPKVVQFVADDLGLPIVGQKAPKPPPRSKDRFSWADHLRQALLMLSYGHMYFEQVYRVDPDGSAAHLRKLAPRMPKTIERIDVAADGGLVSIKQYWSSTNGAENTIPVNRLVAYIHEREGGNWLGTSILRPAYKNWLLKDRLLRVQAQTIERNGMGIPLYKAAEGATEMATGLAMAKAWRAGDAAGSAVPFGADLILRGVEGTLPDAEPAVRYHDEQIGRAVLAHFLNLGTQTGSWALGTTFADFFTLSLQTLADQVADTATQHIVEDLVDINFGEDEPAPRIVCDEIGSRQAATAEALAALVKVGLVHPDEILEESTRQQYGLPPKDPNAPPPGPLPTSLRETMTGQLGPDGKPVAGPAAPPTSPPDASGTDASAAVAAMQGVAASGRAARVAAKFNPDEPRMPDGKWGGGGVVGDALKLAGKVDLEPGETLVGSSKVKADTGTVRMAVTEQHGHRSVRLGIGDVAFGSRDDQAGPWRAGRNDLRDRNSKADALSRERGRLEAEHEALSATHDPLVAKYRATAHGGPALTDAEHAELERLADRRDAIANRLDEIDAEDTDVVSASGYTTKLDASQVQQLHGALTAALARAKAAEPEHQRAWDAVPDGINPDLPLADLGSGSIPGQWGDVHYLGFIDEPELGPQFELAVVPHGMTLPDVRDAETHATLDARETALFLRQLAKAGGIQAKARVTAGAAAELLGEDVDEQADAITAALDEWVDSQLPEEVEAKFNPDELRVPGGKGGGRWTQNPIGKAISDALDAWGKGKGPDDPFTFDGKPIDREPLRKAAVARGITLKRGASRDDIVHALLGGVRDEVKTQRAERQKRVGSSKFSIDVGGKVDPEAARQVEVENKIRAAYRDLATNPNSHVMLADLRERSDVSRADFDAALVRLSKEGGQFSTVHLAPQEDQKRLTPRLRDASIRHGDENMHMVAFEDPSPRPMPTPVGGKRIDVAVYTGTDANAPSLREVSSANRPGRVITSQKDLAGLEQWAHDNGHTDVAQWAAGERARAEAKNAPKAAKVAKKAASKAVTYALAPDLRGPLARKRHAERDDALVALSESSDGLGASGDLLEQFQVLGNQGFVQYDGKRWHLTDKGHEYIATRDPAASKAVKSAPGAAKDASGVPKATKRVPKAAKAATPDAGADIHPALDRAIRRTAAEHGGPAVGTSALQHAADKISRARQSRLSEPKARPSASEVKAHLQGLPVHQGADAEQHARDYIDGLGLTGPQLKQLASELEVPLVGRTKPSMRDDIVKVLVGGRVTTAAVERGVPLRAPSAPHPDGLDAYEGPRLKSYAAEFLDSTSGMDDNQIRAALRAQGVGSPAVEQAKRAAEDAKAPKVKAPAAPSAAALSHDPAVRLVQVQNRIRAAYTAVLDRRGRYGENWVNFDALRKELGNDIPRNEVDDALIEMSYEVADDPLGRRPTNIVPENNQKMLTQAQRDAALSIGNQHRHLIRIEDPSPRPLPAGGARPKVGSGPVASGRGALTAGQLDLSGVRKVPGVSDAERKAADLYANDAQRINNLIREGHTGSATIRGLDGLLDRSSVSSDVELWRGLRSGEGQFGGRLTGDLTGAEFTEPAYLSTTANRQVAEHFAGSFGDPAPVVMHLVAPAGTNAVTISDWGSGDAIGGQAEVLLQRGLRMRVVADHGVEPHPQIPAGVRRLDVEIVPPGAGPKGDGLTAIRSSAPDWEPDDAGPPMEGVAAAAGHDVTPGHDELHHYWTRTPEGLAKWQGSPHPWTTLRDHLLKYLPPGEAERAASKWFLEVFHFASGSDLNRVSHGHPPRGHRVGPG